MATWHFSGGAKVITSEYAVHVTGAGELADVMRADLAALARGEAPPVGIYGAAWLDLDTGSPWLLNRWCELAAARLGESVSSDVGELLPPRQALEILLEQPVPEGSVH